MGPDEDNLTAFLTRYREACAEAGVEPLPVAELAALAESLLSSTDVPSVILHSAGGRGLRHGDLRRLMNTPNAGRRLHFGRVLLRN